MSDEPNNLNPRPVSPTGGGTPRDPPSEDGTGAEVPAVPAEDRALAASLAELAPAPANINRDGLMFAAGTESRRWVVRLWQLTAGVLAAVGFFAGMYFRPPTVVERVVYVEQPPSAAGPIAREPAKPPSGEKAVPQPQPPATESEAVVPSGTAYFPTGDPRRWLQVRDDVLSAGVGAIPDHGRQPSPAPNVALNQPAPLPRGVFDDPK